ncbi:uncharacterized protein B0I36DRAFT_314667 [Microdochium trichocladiopsis]|uniref:Zn(2)-C6 fungal-type domain-containing protein n=1 Tax=Microdochium trichocladiopsis TaxID=1682393 RepID=A0A9P8YF26_9PEZI|nr:uncharacterized protein B0I36DRAFT_314667 [Microdochium trichocladiopsis]KAH7037712.1 hypothetical protein B0I36DRAFT_314667 [Microdochium trichocladiopsis]
MASVSSASPSGYHFHHAESDSDWDYVQSGGAPSSVGLGSSPGAGSMHSWGMVNFQNHPAQPSPPALSPLNLDSEQQKAVLDSSFPERHPPPSPLTAAASMDTQFMASFDTEVQQDGLNMDQQFVFEQEFFNTHAFGEHAQQDLFANLQNDFPDFTDFTSLDVVASQPQQQQQPLDLNIPQQFREENNVPPWDPTNLKVEDFSGTSSDGSEFLSQSPLHFTPSPNSHSSSPGPSEVKPESGKAPTPIRKTKSGKIEKSKPTSKFVIMTPTLINAQSGRPNPFECFEAMRATQRGRKGPLANDTKENALQVRRLGACFCCHSRKVKCDKERPCKNCKKLTTQVPQIVCWQFHDFLPVLFPDFIRGHFKKEQMNAFLADHIQDFTLRGAEQTCSVEFFSGKDFQSTLTVPASFFTPKTAEVLQHWHLNPGAYQIDLQSRGSVPIGVNPDNSMQREELKRRSREYIHNLTFEPMYAEQVTDAIRTTHVPRRILKIVQKYAQKSNSPMVKRALSIHVMHYVLTRQLCMTNKTIVDLQHTNMVPQNNPFITARVLNRQVKAMLDEMLLKEMQALFDSFSKTLKPKSRKGWAPCMASFLVLCLFMETVETAADTFVISQNEINMRNRSKPQFKREFALDLCKEIDNLPFKQFAYQFHQIYQTHTKDITAKAFNPLLDDSFAQQDEIDAPTMEMVTELRHFIEGDGWHELDFLVADPILPNEETHPYPRNVSLNYTGRLIARFLLSFTDERYLFDGQY